MTEDLKTLAAKVVAAHQPAIASAFNEWMRQYTENPEEFTHDWQTVDRYLTELANGEEPTYGQWCAAFLLSLLDRAVGGGFSDDEGCPHHGTPHICVDRPLSGQQAVRSSVLGTALSPAPQALAGESFQARVQPWMMACFGPKISGDRVERADRLLEEAFELLQSGGYDPARVVALRDYVWSREVGEPSQEVGGVMVTLAAYCLAHGLDMHAAAEAELARVWTKVEKIRAKQAAKPVGSALPQTWTSAPQALAGEAEKDAAIQVICNAIDRFQQAPWLPPAVRILNAITAAGWLSPSHAREQAERIARLEAALADLLSWFPDAPSKPEWRIPAGEHGADDAITEARARLAEGGRDNG